MVLEVGVRPAALGEAQVGRVPNHGPLSLEPGPVVGRHRQVGRLARHLHGHGHARRDDACAGQGGGGEEEVTGHRCDSRCRLQHANPAGAESVLETGTRFRG